MEIANPIYDVVFKYMMEDNSVNEEEIPEKYRPLFRRLKMAASSQEVKKQMQDEDEVWDAFKSVEREGYHKGRKEMEEVILQKIAQKDEMIAQKDKSLAQKDEMIAQKEQALEKSKEENEALKREIEQLKKSTK